jgi:hypothetical protein
VTQVGQVQLQSVDSQSVDLSHRCVRALAWVTLLPLLLAACVDNGVADAEKLTHLHRRGQFGSLRDFVLYDRPQDPAGSALLVDRFEVTQDDWAAFATTKEGMAVAARATSASENGALPASNMNLQQARGFAQWRLGRLPTDAEWQRATVAGGSSLFPWGGTEFATHANSGNLGLGEPTPVGTFESGRRAGRNSPYDLIGNVREWTETVPASWCGETGLASSFTANRRRVLITPVLSVWSILRLVPPAMAATVGPGDVPRRVVGVDFETPLSDIVDPKDDSQMAGERRLRTGMRVYTTVDELLGRLLGMTRTATAEERLQLRRFVTRKGHAKVLTAAFSASTLHDQRFAKGSIAEVLSTALRTELAESK